VSALTGGDFTSDPQLNAAVVNLSSAFQTAQGSVRATAPPAVRGRIVTPPLITVAGATVTVNNAAGVVTSLGLTPAQAPLVRLTPCISAAELLAGTRTHEHLGRISHKQNCLRALRALDPKHFMESFVHVPGAPAVNFQPLMQARVTEVFNARATHNEVDESATRTAGALRFVTGSQIPVVNLSSTGSVLAVWNPTTNAPLT